MQRASSSYRAWHRWHQVFIGCLAILMVFASLGYSPDRADAANYTMRVGYYAGTGSTKAITGLGFQPELVLIAPSTTAGVGVFKSNSMPANATAYFSATANNTGTNITLNSDGFTLGTLANVNSANVLYRWIAFRGSDCTSTGLLLCWNIYW